MCELIPCGGETRVYDLLSGVDSTGLILADKVETCHICNVLPNIS